METGHDMTTLEILQKAKELIKEREFWIKGSNATDSDRNAIAIMSPSACRFCMNGALLRITGFDGQEAIRGYDNARRALYDVLGEECLHRFNDKLDTTHEDVMSVFDKAILRARKHNQ